MDAKYLLAQSKLKEAQKLLDKVGKKKKKKKKKKHIKGIDKNASRHPYKPINWDNKIKFYATAILATDAVGSDGFVIPTEEIRKIADKYAGMIMPVFNNFQTTKSPIGTSKIDGIDKKDKVTRIISQTTFIVDKNLAEDISNGKYAITYSFLSKNISIKSSGIREINGMQITGISLIPVSDIVDKNCKIIDVYKDQDIDKKLEG